MKLHFKKQNNAKKLNIGEFIFMGASTNQTSHHVQAGGLIFNPVLLMQ